MKITIDKAQKIIDLFTNMNSKKDFLTLLNISKNFIYKENTLPFTEKQLNYYLIKDSKKFNSKRKSYTEFTINKKSGGKRTINAPIKGLKEFQKALNLILQSVHEPHKNATGFIQERSIIDNASAHVGQNYVYNIDLKDFFPSIDASRVWGRLLYPPFNLKSTPERKHIANMIKTLCCTELEVERYKDGEWKKEKKLVLPQGAPTSPTLTNAICDKLDRRLTGVAKRFGLNYSRYADDITFSSSHNSFKNQMGELESIYSQNSTFKKELLKVIREQNFHIKESKVRLQKRGYKQEVTGIIVNDKINVSRTYIKNLRHLIYFWEKYGFEKASELFLKKYILDKGHLKKVKPNMAMVIEGKLLYLKMVKGDRDKTYLKLKERFDNLINSNSTTNHSDNIDDKTHLTNLFHLNELFKNGYENALKSFID